ncbi:hypothetical protein B795N_14960 [Marinilactibacillus psychrotolerans]|uniref:hypothetical protein n=1 Tax=Marinilactibacillus psychrotolerans TaxID=191770 RepID=UPI001C7CD2B9|nr:hypothetical protein [Marinilactibacillus psychrotolerans]GEQ33614.1 hypothetical protein B795N_14960 [Marinilactibacillus psychrotolerans]
MEEEVILLNPDKMGYKDRGKMKWQGLILTHQTEAYKKLEQEYASMEVKQKEEMSQEEISEVLYEAFITRSPVAIQASVLRDGNYYPDVICMVVGHLGEKIILQLKDDRIKRVSIDLMRNVEMFDKLSWHNKRK